MIYLVVTEKGTWGKGRSLYQAATEAHITEPVKAHIFHASEDIVDLISINEKSGGCVFTLKEGVPVSFEFMFKAVFFGAFNISLVKSRHKVILQ